MTTYEDIKRANDSIRTMTISRTDKKTGQRVDKEYAEVNQRIKAFRMVYPEGFIITDMLSNENGVCIFEATVGWTDEHGNSHDLGTGHAYEKETASFINQTSYIENCETSAVGRALGMAGFGIDTSVASYEEVGNAMLNQDDNAPKFRKRATDKQLEILRQVYVGDNMDKLLEANHIDKLEELSLQKASELISKLKERQ